MSLDDKVVERLRLVDPPADLDTRTQTPKGLVPVTQIGGGNGRVTVADQPFRFNLRTATQIADEVHAAPRPRFLVRGLLVEGDYGVLGATRKLGKSFLVADLAVSIASGTAFLGKYAIDRTGPVLLFAGEGGDRKIVRRLEAVAAHKGAPKAMGLITVVPRAPKLGDHEHVAALEHAIHAQRPLLTIIDPAYLALSGAKTSDLAAMGELLERAQLIAQAHGSALLLVHHFNKTGVGTGADRLAGSGFAEWARVIITGSIKTTSVDPVTRASNVVVELEVIGDETAGTSIMFRRTVGVVGDDPDDLSAPMHYKAEVINWEEMPGDVPPEQIGLPVGARRMLAVLADANDWLGTKQIGDRLANDGKGSPLKKHTILGYARKLVERRLVEVHDPGSGEPHAWRVLDVA